MLKRQNSVKLLLKKIELFQTKLVEHFGKFMLKAKVDSLAQNDLPHRIVLMDFHGMKTMYDNWVKHENRSGGSPFDEIGVRYYTQKVAELAGVAVTTDESEENAIRYYQSILDKYGDDVHRVYFGMPVDRAQKRRIISEMNSERARKLLPSLYEEHFVAKSSDDITDFS